MKMEFKREREGNRLVGYHRGISARFTDGDCRYVVQLGVYYTIVDSIDGLLSKGMLFRKEIGRAHV